MSDMEDATEQFARDLAIASGDLPNCITLMGHQDKAD